MSTPWVAVSKNIVRWEGAGPPPISFVLQICHKGRLSAPNPRSGDNDRPTSIDTATV
jgi:hypothetical protein